MNEARDVFEQIYATAHWEGGSGQGSRPEVTEVYRIVVERLIGSSDVRTVVDAGCGDWEFARLIDWSAVTYTGFDVVPGVLATNRANFSSPHVAFEYADLSTSRLPPADLLLCKDVLQHWPIDAISRFLATNRGRYRYMLLTNDVASVHCPPESLNGAIPMGAWRTLDLEKPPFHLHPAWRLDYKVGAEWTKRVLLLVARRHHVPARHLGRSALNRARQIRPE